jgi:hypothetical protein
VSDDRYLNAKVIGYWGPVCESGRHYPPHPGDTCAEIDAFIAARDEALGEWMRAGFERLEREFRSAPLTGTVFEPATKPEPPMPELPAIRRALDILRPHLAWDHRYTA